MKNAQLRIRSVQTQTRAIEGATRSIAGYAAVFEQLSENLGMLFEVREKIAKGAFAESLRSDVQMGFWNHNMDLPLASTKNGSLRLKEDDHGLAFEMDLPDTTVGNDVYRNVKEGIVDSMSFGFVPEDEEIEHGERATDVTTITVRRAKLIEVSPVVFPAYPQTQVSARNFDEIVSSKIDELERGIKAMRENKNSEQMIAARRARQAQLERYAKLPQNILNIE